MSESDQCVDRSDKGGVMGEKREQSLSVPWTVRALCISLGIVVLIAFLSFGALPERSFFEWVLFYALLLVALLITKRFLVRHATTSSIFILGPIVVWHTVWVVVQLIRGTLCTLCITHLICIIAVGLAAALVPTKMHMEHKK